MHTMGGTSPTRVLPQLRTLVWNQPTPQHLLLLLKSPACHLNLLKLRRGHHRTTCRQTTWRQRDPSKEGLCRRLLCPFPLLRSLKQNPKHPQRLQEESPDPAWHPFRKGCRHLHRPTMLEGTP